MAEARINTRLPKQLADYVNEICGPHGFYETASEFVRELIRQHYEKNEQYKWQALNMKLAPGANANISEFEVVNPEEQLKQFKTRYKKEK